MWHTAINWYVIVHTVRDRDANQSAEVGNGSEVAEQIVLDNSRAIPNADSVAEVLENIGFHHESARRRKPAKRKFEAERSEHAWMGIHCTELVVRLVVGIDPIVFASLTNDFVLWDELPMSFPHTGFVEIFPHVLGATPVECTIGG